MLSDEDIDQIATGARNPLGGIYATSVREFANAAYALGVERARRVKPLVWMHFGLRDIELWIADGEHYEVRGACGLFSAKSGVKVLNGQCTADEAKSACQQHHEAFVLSQLEQL